MNFCSFLFEVNEKKMSFLKSHGSPGVCAWLILLIKLYSNTVLKAMNGDEWRATMEQEISVVWRPGSALAPAITGD